MAASGGVRSVVIEIPGGPGQGPGTTRRTHSTGGTSDDPVPGVGFGSDARHTARSGYRALPRDHGRPRRRPDGGGGDLVRRDRTALRRDHRWHRRLGGGRRILGGPDRREQAAPARGSGSCHAATDHRYGRPAAARSGAAAARWLGRALAMQRPITATDGWEATLLQPKEDAVDTYSQRFITAD